MKIGVEFYIHYSSHNNLFVNWHCNFFTWNIFIACESPYLTVFAYNSPPSLTLVYFEKDSNKNDRDPGWSSGLERYYTLDWEVHR